VDILNSALLDVKFDKNSTENSKEITDGKYDEFIDDNELFLAEVCYMITVTSVEDENWEELQDAFQ